MIISPVEDELFHAGGQAAGQTDMMKLTVTMRNFANTDKNIQYCDEDNFTPNNAV